MTKSERLRSLLPSRCGLNRAYVGWTEDDAVFHRKFVDALLEKLRGGVYEAVQCKAAINAIRARLEGGV